MTKMIVELAGALLAIIFAGVILKKNAVKAKKALAVSFALTFAAMIAFSLAQLGSELELLEIELAYRPLDVLSLLAVIYCISAVAAKGSLFDKLIGE